MLVLEANFIKRISLTSIVVSSAKSFCESQLNANAVILSKSKFSLRLGVTQPGFFLNCQKQVIHWFLGRTLSPT
jgi:4-hydroxy-3-methylbut-2-en-1-yl diphosphate synthase IspG/GcpE